MSLRRAGIMLLLVGAVLLGHPAVAHADIIRGIANLIGAVFEIPRATLAGTFSGPPILGTAVGLLSGTFNSVTMVASGALELLGSAIPIAKTVAPFLIPVFL